MAKNALAAAVEPIEDQPIALGGGLNLVTPALVLPPSYCIAAVNFEAQADGYRRFQGFERYDGQVPPSASSYWVLSVDHGTAAITAGQAVTGATSGATGIALINATVDTGSYGGSDAAGKLVLWKVMAGFGGDFLDNENLQVAAVTKAQANGTPAEKGAGNDADNTTWTILAIEAARTAIQVVPGGGRITGVWFYAGSLWAFREDDPDVPTVCRMYRATALGWELQDLGRYVAFTSGGAYEIVPGDSIVGATSGASALVVRLFFGNTLWSATNAAGFLYLINQTGTFTAENLNVGANLDVATIAGDSTGNALLPGGSFEFVTENFYGDDGDQCMYGVDGVNNAFEWDGVVMAPITTGLSSKPIHIGVNRDRLWLAFPRGMLDGSVIGQPLNYSGVDGAVEFGLGAEITNLLGKYAGTLVIWCTDHISILYGTDAADFDLQPLSTDVGARPGTVAVMDTPIFEDNRGLRKLPSVQAFGNFATAGNLTEHINPLLDVKRAAGVSITTSMRVRTMDSYRLFFSDGTAISAYFADPRKDPQVMPLDLGMPVRCCCAAEDGNTKEVKFFGSDDGYVYQIDSGTSLDGLPLRGYIRLAFNSNKRPNQNKRYHKVTLETNANPRATIAVTAAFSYGHPDVPAVIEQQFSISSSGGLWDEANWDNTFWDNPVKGRAEAWIDGEGFNISPTISTEAIYEPAFTIHGMIQSYSLLGRVP